SEGPGERSAAVRFSDAESTRQTPALSPHASRRRQVGSQTSKRRRPVCLKPLAPPGEGYAVSE
ncbi:MAG: hypothetical protein ACREBC_25300, partial [Pyrinomonadaceae bacterium]